MLWGWAGGARQAARGFRPRTATYFLSLPRKKVGKERGTLVPCVSLREPYPALLAPGGKSANSARVRASDMRTSFSARRCAARLRHKGPNTLVIRRTTDCGPVRGVLLGRQGQTKVLHRGHPVAGHDLRSCKRQARFAHGPWVSVRSVARGLLPADEFVHLGQFLFDFGREISLKTRQQLCVIPNLFW